MSDKVTKCFAEICMTNEARAEAAEAERDLHIEEINALRKDGDDLHAQVAQLQARVAELEAALREISNYRPVREAEGERWQSWFKAIQERACTALQQEPNDGRKPGHSKLVYDKATRTIVDEGTRGKRLSLPLDGGDGE